MKVLLKGFVLLFVIAVLSLGGLVFVIRRSGDLGRAPTAAGRENRGIDAQGRTPEEENAIRKFLVAERRKGVSLRPAADGDGVESDSRRELEGLYADYHPFFVRGDLDGDGRLDFVQAFVETWRGGPWFDVAVFFGREDGVFAEPVLVERGVSLATGDLSIDRSVLVLTPDVTRDEARRWRYEPLDRKFVDADAIPASGPPASDEPEETPDEKPRLRV
jgi:hypothetical protein